MKAMLLIKIANRIQSIEKKYNVMLKLEKCDL